MKVNQKTFIKIANANKLASKFGACVDVYDNYDNYKLVALYYGKENATCAVSTFGANKVKAFAALVDGITINKNARKTHNFLLNLSGSVEPVTVDRWHVRACLLKAGSRVEDVSVAVNDHQYDRVELITKKLAKREGVNPCEFQAIIWVAIRNRLNGKLK